MDHEVTMGAVAEMARDRKQFTSREVCEVFGIPKTKAASLLSNLTRTRVIRRGSPSKGQDGTSLWVLR